TRGGAAVSFREVIETVRLRWQVAAVVLLMTLAMGWKVDHPPRVYQATSVLLLVPPQEPSAPNALAAATPSIAATGLVVDTILNDSSSADRLREAGVTGDYSLLPRNNGTVQTPKYTVPAEQLTVTGADPDALLASINALSKMFVEELADLQTRAGVPQSLRITTQQLVAPAVAQVHGSKLRGLAGVAVLGATGCVVLPLWFDRYVRRGSRRTRGGGGRLRDKRNKSTEGSADVSERVPA
ncbi:hypothetical protein KGA66_10065, partial [Actinocrinis puniceicyclus]